ncbi:MAG: DUF3572 domain-containing protein [Paracoccaceae bacterium]
MSGQESAETLALQVLTWMAGDDEIFTAFLSASGASAPDVAGQAADPVFLASVLDFLLLEDRWIMGFCDATGLRYDAPMRARAALPGGGAMNWT